MPSLFVIGVIVGIPLCFVHPLLKTVYLCTTVFYLTLTFLSSFSVRPSMWIITWLGVIATHFVYGVRFLTGILSKQMPCETTQFDHQSEKSEK